MKKLFEITYQNGSNEIVSFKQLEDLNAWLETMYVLGNRIRGTVINISEMKMNEVIMNDYYVIGITNTGFKTFHPITAESKIKAIEGFMKITDVSENFFDKIEVIIKDSVLLK